MEQMCTTNQLSGSELVSCCSGSFTAGNTNFGSLDNCTSLINTVYYPYYQTWYPSYPVYVQGYSKLEQGFKIVGKLLEEGIIEKKLNVKEFVKLVHDVTALL